MAEITSLLEAIAALLWPIFAFVLLFLFRQELRDMSGRLKKFKGLGLEAELDALQKVSQKAAEEVRTLAPSDDVKQVGEEAGLDVPPLPPTANESKMPSVNPSTNNSEAARASINQIYAVSAQSPQAGLMLLSSEIEQEMRKLIDRRGLEQRDRPLSVMQMNQLLSQDGSLPVDIANAVRQFWQVRNQIVHGYNIETSEALQAIDSGATILKTLQAVPPMKWKDAVFKAARRYAGRHRTNEFSRQGLIQEEFETIKSSTATTSKNPEQTLSWALQQLEQEGRITRIGSGSYQFS